MATVGRRVAIRKSSEKMENLSRIQLQQLQEKGISPEKLQGQVESFKKGFPFARIVSAAVEKDGVDCFGPEEKLIMAGILPNACKPKKDKRHALDVGNIKPTSLSSGMAR